MKLVFYPDPVLTRVADIVTEITPDLRRKAEEMVPFMELEGGIGLAAPQVGWGVQVLVASVDGTPENARVYLNPKVVWTNEEKEWAEEGCLSFPGIYGEVLRPTQIRIQAQSLDGDDVVEEAAELYARVLQHEIDHLNGILFVTKMRPADRLINKAKLTDLKRRYLEAPEPTP